MKKSIIKFNLRYKVSLLSFFFLFISSCDSYKDITGNDVFTVNNLQANQDYYTKAVLEYHFINQVFNCLLYTSPSPRDRQKSRMPSSA